jgi:hypothetical protein
MIDLLHVLNRTPSRLREEWVEEDTGLHHNKCTKAIGAQTERRDLAGPVRALLGRETSPAAFISWRRRLRRQLC